VSISEFDLIRRFFAEATLARPDVLLGIGDDAALLCPPADKLVVVSMDTLVEGRHFLPGCDPAALGHKSLAVNLSDLAAMGAEPAWATLSLTLPEADERWLSGFIGGFAGLAASHKVQLVGGDTTRGPLSITVQAHGLVAADRALRRAAASPGELLCVSGTPGDAGLALDRLAHGAPDTEMSDYLRERLERPTPRVALGRILVGRASAAIDISDGLVADLRHICVASSVGARIELARLPVSAQVAAVCARGDWRYPLAGGDDYELLFSVAPERSEALLRDCAAAGQQVRQIGRLVDGSEITLVFPDGRVTKELPDGFDHFDR
jgi:thiamine-monophosphate kinase